jgi:hypothetical protein
MESFCGSVFTFAGGVKEKNPASENQKRGGANERNQQLLAES